MSIISQYSVFIAMAALLLVAGLVLFRGKPTSADIAAFLAVAVALIVAWVLLRPYSKLTANANPEFIQQSLELGNPVLLEFYSKYSVESIRIQPILDMLEEQFYVHLTVVRVDIQSDMGRELAEVYKVDYTPTFIYFNVDGSERWRSAGALDISQVRESIVNP